MAALVDRDPRKERRTGGCINTAGRKLFNYD